MVRAPVSERRLDILQWLKHRPTPVVAPRGGDPAHCGVTGEAIAAGLRLPLRIVRSDLALLTRVGLLRADRAGPLTYYRRDEVRIAEVARMFEKGW
ncbi:ArsR family transcriptional regulator [Streptomyces sp. Ru71]|uniref:ArsR family transcriptional regulator n=1 Tax=Streptomyces sp. Ru71 TaxID=2080746 RepID=UPI000CDDAE2E|nr:ArsR family transcriptional regulator [Streptomyces sp. Ru71]POX46488.1 ArsR family transcriptional regulator [Streptomyces sp. Ru71]